jgi:carbamoyltransferase
MRFLAIASNGHDSAIAMYDNGNVRYHKFEREFNIKHFIINEIEIIEDHAERIFGVPVADYDAVGLVPLNIYPIRGKGTPYDGIEEYGYSLKYLQKINPNSFMIDHHHAHALSGWMINDSPDVQITIDAVGGDASWTVWRNGNLVHRHLFENGSIGQEINELAKSVGVKAMHDVDLAGKLMGLQSYGDINYDFLNFLRENTTIDSFTGMSDARHWETYFMDHFAYFNKPLDWIATVHQRLGELVLDIFEKYAKPEDSIIYAGGVAQNVIWNTALKRLYPKLDVIPHSGDEGQALGAIEWLRIKYDQPVGTIENFPYAQNDQYAEPASDEVIEQTALALAHGEIVAWYQGNGEIGPRALGNRSLLVSPMLKDVKDKLNLIKKREKYRPFGASVLEEYADLFFDEWVVDKYMVYTAIPKETIPGITHVDGTCRVQTVGDENPTFKKLLEKFYELTGCAVVLNTSLNTNGSPTCSTKSNARAMFEHSTMLTHLVIGDKIYKK